MRHFTIIILVVCAILVGGFVYIEYDTNKFIENLSAPPVSTEEQGKSSNQMSKPPLSIEETHSVDAQDPQVFVDEVESHPPVHHTGGSQQHDHARHLPPAVGNYNLDPNRTSFASENESHAENDLMPDPPEPFEGLKKKLIEKHGDIPLIHTYIELRKKRLDRQQMTMDEVSTLWEAIMFFNPTPANQKTYELIKRLSSQADPGSFKVIYDPQKLQQKRISDQ